MRVRRPAAWLGLGLSLLLAGCSTVYDIVVTGDLDRPTVAFRQAGKAIDLCLHSLEVRERSDGARRGRVVWDIRAEGECVTLKSLAYGDTPARFTTVHAAEPLTEGVGYEAFGLGGTAGVFSASAAGGASFTYQDGSGWETDGPLR